MNLSLEGGKEGLPSFTIREEFCGTLKVEAGTKKSRNPELRTPSRSSGMETWNQRVFLNPTWNSFTAIERCEDESGFTGCGPVVPGLRKEAWPGWKWESPALTQSRKANGTKGLWKLKLIIPKAYLVFNYFLILRSPIPRVFFKLVLINWSHLATGLQWMPQEKGNVGWRSNFMSRGEPWEWKGWHEVLGTEMGTQIFG